MGCQWKRVQIPLALCWEHSLASRFRDHRIEVDHHPRLWGKTPDLKVGDSTIVECAVLQLREEFQNLLNTTGGYGHGGSVEESGKRLYEVVSVKVATYGSLCERDGLAYVIALCNQSEEWHEAADVFYGDSSFYVICCQVYWRGYQEWNKESNCREMWSNCSSVFWFVTFCCLRVAAVPGHFVGESSLDYSG